MSLRCLLGDSSVTRAFVSSVSVHRNRERIINIIIIINYKYKSIGRSELISLLAAMLPRNSRVNKVCDDNDDDV